MNLGFDVKDWENVQPIEIGEFESVELGGHKVVIVDARLYTSELTNNTSLKVSVDLAQGDKQAGYFKKQYDENPNADKKWSNGATRYLSLKKESLAYTKGFITALEKSNNGFKFDTTKDWEQLKGLVCAGVFGLEEYQDQEGEVKTATKLTQFRSLDKLNEIKIPRVKLIDGSLMDYDAYINRAKNNTQKDSVVILNADELPF